jgi:hypothetical protein
MQSPATTVGQTEVASKSLPHPVSGASGIRVRVPLITTTISGPCSNTPWRTPHSTASLARLRRRRSSAIRRMANEGAALLSLY